MFTYCQFIREVANAISFGSCQGILTDVLGMKRASTKIVLKLHLLGDVDENDDPDLLKKVITSG